MSGGGFLASAIQIVAGAALMLATGGTAGLSLIVSGVLSAAAVALMPNAGKSNDERSSPTYGYGNFQNPVKGDATLPVIYSAEGHKHAPVWLQAFVTPRGEFDEQINVVKNRMGQSLSGLLGVCEGPVEDIFDIKVNDEPVYTSKEDLEIGTGNGTKKVFEIDAGNIDLHSVAVKLVTSAGVVTEKGFFLTSKSEQIGTGNGARKIFKLNITEEVAQERGVLFYNQDPVRNSGNAPFDPDNADSSGILPRAWLGSPTLLYVNTQALYPAGWQLWAKYFVWATASDTKIEKVTVTDSKGNDKEIIRITFSTAPASGTKVTATFRRKTFAGVRFELRYGTDHQLPIWGFDNIRNTFGVGRQLTSSWVTHETKSEVNDIIFDITTGPNGFGSFDDEGELGHEWANFEIEIKLKNPSSSLASNTFFNWTRLKDPQPARKNKTASEFQIYAKSQSQLFSAYSVRGILTRIYKSNPNDAVAKKRLEDFTSFPHRYEMRVRRSGPNPERGLTSNQHIDALFFASWQEVQDERLNYPGVALIAFHALGSEKLNGSAPSITCRVKGRNDILFYSSANGGEWRKGDVSTQKNRVWAFCDLVLNKRYGAGEHYTTANIDAASAKECADWLDEQVEKKAGETTTEARSELSIVLDVRRQLTEQAREICSPGRVWAIWRGQTLVFEKDDRVTLIDSVGVDAVPVIYDDTRLGRTAKNTLVFTRPTLAERPTELQIAYLSNEKEFEQREVWVAPTSPAEDERRIMRIQAYGTTRDTEMTRFGRFAYLQARSRGAIGVVGVSPAGMHFGAGRVIRIISNRVGVDGYWRIRRCSMDSTNWFTRLDLQPYDPNIYGQNYSQVTVLNVPGRTKSASVSSPSSATSGTAQTGAASGTTTASIQATRVARTV